MGNLEEHVLEYCKELSSIKWFSNLGGGFRLPDMMVGGTQLASSMAEASLHVISTPTSNFLVRSRNLLSQEATKFDLASMTSKQRWIVQREYEGYLDTHLDPVMAAIDYSEFDEVFASKFKDLAQWIIVRTCFARRYLGISSAARFYDGMLYVFSQGNCVAGWEGDYSEGSLIVY